MQNRISFILIVESAIFVVIYSQLDLSDRCQVARSGAEGICRFYEDCPVVLNELIDHGLIPEKCGFQNRREIICCPVPPTPKPSPAPQIPNRISAKSKRTYLLNKQEIRVCARGRCC